MDVLSDAEVDAVDAGVDGLAEAVSAMDLLVVPTLIGVPDLTSRSHRGFNGIFYGVLSPLKQSRWSVVFDVVILVPNEVRQVRSIAFWWEQTHELWVLLVDPHLARLAVSVFLALSGPVAVSTDRVMKHLILVGLRPWCHGKMLPPPRNAALGK